MKHLKVYLSFFLFLNLFYARAQNNILSNSIYKYTATENLKSTVKSIKFKLYNSKRNITSDQKRKFFKSRDMKESAYNSLYPNGLHRLLTFTFADTVYHIIEGNEPFVTMFKYDENDILEKAKIKLNYKHYYPISDSYLLLNANYIASSNDDEVDSSGKAELSVYQIINAYTYNQKGQIKEILQYFVDQKDTLELVKRKDEDLELRIVNEYNQNDQVIKQKVFKGPKKVLDPSFEFSYESTRFCSDLEIRYKYDSKNRVTQALLYGCGKIVIQEDYTYHNTQDYIEKAAYFLNGTVGGLYPSPKFIKTFNENGDIIKKEYLPDYEGQDPDTITPRFYSYEYDSHKNWIKCYMYLEGTKEGEPTMIGERQIEYYNEAKK